MRPARVGQGDHGTRDGHAPGGRARPFSAAGLRPYDPLMGRKSIVVALFVVGFLTSTITGLTRPAIAADNPVVIENQQPGTSAWRLSKTADDVNGQVKGYASAVSVMPGGSLSLFVSVNPAQTYTVDVYRIGWYGGLGGRLRLHDGPLNGTTQTACVPDATTGMIACGWTPSYSFT